MRLGLGLSLASVAPASTPAFTPADVTGLKAWFGHDSIVNSAGAVGTWTNKITSGGNLTQATSDKPIYSATANNSLPGIHCTGTQWLQGDGIVGLNAAAYTIFAVGAYANSSTQIMLSVSDDANPLNSAGVARFLDANSTEYVQRPNVSNSDASNGFLDGTFHVRTAAISAAGARYWQDGTLRVTDNTIGINTNPCTTIAVGAAHGGSLFLTGYMQALLVYNSVLSDPNIALVQAFLKDLYGTP